MTGPRSILGDVASTSDVFAANMEVLLARDAVLARRIVETSGAAHARVEPSRAGPPTLRLTLDGREVSFASAYDPVREAARLIDVHDTGSFHSYFVLGFALGYHVEELCARAHPRSAIFVFEESLSLFRTALEARDLRAVLGDPRVHLLVALDRPAVNAALAPFVTPILVGTRVVPHVPSVESFPADYARLRETIRDFITYAQTCMTTTVTISVESRRNVMMNAPYYCFCPGIDDLEGILKGRPAVIAAAGPSLQRNIDQLARVRGRGVLIAMSTSLKPLLARGIVPDFVCFIDFAWLSRKYFTGLEGFEPITMVVEPKGDWGTVDVHPGPKVVLRDDYIDLVLGGVGPKKAALRPGATVAHLAYYFAEFLGADPIVFVGQDLSFPDGIVYTPGTVHHDLWQLECNRFQTLEMKEWERILRMRGRLFRVKDVHGREIYTDQQMFTYLQQFERDFAGSSATIIDATEGGAAKAGTTAMTFAEAFDTHFTRELPPEVLHVLRNPQGGGLPLSRRPAVLERIDSRIAEAAELREFYREALGVLRKIEEHLDDASRARAFQAEVDRLRAEVKKRGTANALVTRLVQHDEYLKMQRDREIVSAGLTGDALKAEQLTRDIAYVEGLERGAQQLVDILELARVRVSRYTPRPPRAGADA